MTSLPLNPDQTEALTAQGCSATDWAQVQASDGFDPSRVVNVRFIGAVSLGSNSGQVSVGGVDFPAGIQNATIVDCEIGRDVLIANIGECLSNLDIRDRAVIRNVAAVTAEPNAACGVGTRVRALNESGGREVTLFPALNAQIAYLQCIFRHNASFIEALERLIAAEVEAAKRSKAIIGRGAHIRNCGALRNVTVGPSAYIDGAVRLEDGTILSDAKSPTTIGAGVWARSFLIAEGARVDSAARLNHTYVGQGARVANGFSAEDCLFFANCEAYNGEGCALFGGPHSVTHHKSTLLIATLTSFFNAGSGTNQSNHMYKLGPVHQGVLERGCKTGSFAYLLQECHIGAFSVVIGKHRRNLETPDMPFSYIIESQGESVLIPGLNLSSVGLVRDAQKWPSRDRRATATKRDRIEVDVYSPYTIEKMRRGRNALNALLKSDGESDVSYGGARLSRGRMRRGLKAYEAAIGRYLNGKTIARFEQGIDAALPFDQILDSMKPTANATDATKWTDIAGMLALRERIDAVETKVATGAIQSISRLDEELNAIHEAYAKDEWDYVCAAFEAEYGFPPEAMTRETLAATIDQWEECSQTSHRAIVADAKKEFGKPSQIGYGIDQDEPASARDFAAVRGAPETDKTIRRIEDELRDVVERATALREKLKNQD